jgi:replicative DNA helicase
MLGVPTGFADIDWILSGLQPGRMYVVAARPGLGKTAFAVNVSDNIAKRNGHGVVFFSAEVPAFELARRAIASNTKVDSGSLYSGQFKDGESSKIEAYFPTIKETHLKLVEESDITVYGIRAACRRFRADFERAGYPLTLVVVDYLQLIKAVETGGKSKETREREVADMSRELKKMALELEVPVMVLSQLNRSVETRGKGAKPQLSDLRESGAIEQDADVVAFLWEPQPSPSNVEVKYLEFLIAKNRSGKSLVGVPLRYEGRYMRFDSVEEGDMQKYEQPLGRGAGRS